jgi:hypothetical protein
MSWTERRQKLLQQACTLITEWRASGVPIGRAIAIATRKFQNAPLGGGRYLSLSSKSLRRFWDLWKDKKDPSIFALKYKVAERAKFDPVLLRLVIEHCIQNGESLSEGVDALRRKGAKISIRDIYRVLNARAVSNFARTHRQLVAKRKKLEKRFLQSVERVNREFLKNHTALLRRLFKEDARLRLALLRNRDHLQQKFFEADARSVQQREQLQRKVFKRL